MERIYLLNVVEIIQLYCNIKNIILGGEIHIWLKRKWEEGYLIIFKKQ
jgi:hypothetical protein